MAATKLSATPNRLKYQVTGAGTTTIPRATFEADAQAGALKAITERLTAAEWLNMLHTCRFEAHVFNVSVDSYVQVRAVANAIEVELGDAGTADVEFVYVHSFIR